MSYFASSDELPAWARGVPQQWCKDWLKWSVSLSTKRPNEDQRAALPYLSNEDIASWTGKLLREDLEPHDADSRLFQPGDVLFNKLRPYLAKVFHAQFDGASAGELLCLRPSERVEPRYLFYVLTSFGFIDAVDSHTFGSKMPRADWETVGHQPLPLPDIETQRRIARFLDDKTACVEALIEKKQALLGHLGEKRQALITRAVTRGLYPDAPMKPSGLEWVGPIPSEWRVTRLSSFCDFVSGKAHEPYLDPAGEHVLVNARFVSTNGGTEKRCSENLTPASKGDILMVMSDLPNGRALARAYLVTDDRQYAVNQRVCRVCFRRGDPGYFKYQLDRIPSLLAFDDGKEQTHLSNSSFRLLKLLEPPIREQREIASYLHELDRAFKEASSGIEASIGVLAESRAALVTAAVTGQFPELNG